jgi:hypothetical protein
MSITDLIPGFSQAKAIAGVAALAAVAVPSVGWVITAHTLSGVREWQRDVVSTTSTAAHVIDKTGKPALLPTKDVSQQIRALGVALDDVDAAAKLARANNTTNNTRIDTAQVAVGKETGDELDQQLADARAAGAADYARRVRSGPSACPVDRGDPGQSAAATASGPAAATAGAGGVPSLDADDVRICSDNTVKALGWQRWNGRVSAIPQ